MNISDFTLDFLWFFISLLADELRIMSAALVVAAVLYSLIIVTIYMIRNE